MKKKIALILVAGTLLLTSVPFVAFANHFPPNDQVFNPTILNGPLLLCTGTGGGDTGGGVDYYACSNLCDLIAEIANIIYFMIGVVIWIITPILVAVGGIMIMLGGANPEMISRGKKTITGAVWGIVIVLLAWLIVYTFVNAFGGLSKYVGGFGGPDGKAACSIQGS
jgi:hypothetical protein